MTRDASSLFSATTLVNMALIMLIGNGSTTCHAVWHLVHAPLPVAPVAVLGIPVVTKPSIVPVATLPLMLDIPMVLAVGVVPQIHVVPNTAALPPMPAPVLRHAKSDVAANARRRAEGWRLSTNARRHA
jgi:hypothetical protein